MRERKVSIKNNAGIHCRPSSVILNTIHQKYQDHKFTIDKDGEVVQLNSILSLISLGLLKGDSAILQVSGENEDVAIDEIGELFENEYDFPAN